MKTVIHSNHVVFPEQIKEAYLCIEDGLWTQISDTAIMAEQSIEYGDSYLYPGIIDIHSHGYHSWSAKTLDKEEVKGLSQILPSIGVTSTLPTVTGWKLHEREMLETLATAIEEGSRGATLLGIHLEGPFFHPEKHNATPLQEVQEPTIEKLQNNLEAARGHLKYMTIAPDVTGAHEVMDAAIQAGICIGCGHTMASYAEFLEAKQHGMKSSIHTGNAMRQIDRRDVGLLGGALLDFDIYCELICDFFHLSKEMVQLARKIKQDDNKLILISDSDVLSGIAPGTYSTFQKKVTVTKEGTMYLPDGTIYGSTKNVLYGINNLAHELGIPLSTISKMTSQNPATLLGIEDQYGSIAEGHYADFLVFNKNLELQNTYVKGRLVYTKGDLIPLNPQFSKECRRIE